MGPSPQGEAVTYLNRNIQIIQIRNSILFEYSSDLPSTRIIKSQNTLPLLPILFSPSRFIPRLHSSLEPAFLCHPLKPHTLRRIPCNRMKHCRQNLTRTQLHFNYPIHNPTLHPKLINRHRLNPSHQQFNRPLQLIRRRLYKVWHFEEPLTVMRQ